jgi:hypothetical protein
VNSKQDATVVSCPANQAVISIAANGATTCGSAAATGNFVDLTSNQSIGGTKNFTQNLGLGTTTPAFSLDVGSKTDAIALPAGSTTARPSGVSGALRFNTDFGDYELFSNGFWFRREPLLRSDSAGTKAVFTYSGADQFLVVPAGVGRIFAQILQTIPGESLRIVVGQGGIVNMATGYTYGGGASAAQNANDNRYGGSGGGYSGILRGSTPLLLAGGGGGGGSSRTWTGNQGGAGGGITGQKGESAYGAYNMGGNAGTQTAGGAAAPAGSGGPSLPGTQYQGGHASTNCYGGGGGGGYYGGAGGGYLEANTMAGGGGGSGYIGANVALAVLLTGHFREPGLNIDPDLPQTGESNTLVAHGGDVGAPGANGYVVIYY